MNREKILFVVVLGILLLWGGLALMNPYVPARTPGATRTDKEVPELEAFTSLSENERLLTVIAGVGALPQIIDRRSMRARNALVPHSDLLSVAAAVLPQPPARPTPWIGLPVDPFPPVGYYARLREDAILPIASGPSEVEEEDDETAMGGAIDEEPPADDLPTMTDLLGGGKVWEFKAEEWDELVMGPGVKRYGILSMTDASKKAGHTKYSLLLPENSELEFAFEQLNIDSGKMQVSFRKITLASSGVKQIKFADTVENRYWTRRTIDRVRVKDEISLCDLGDWVLELAEEEKYVRAKGLSLAEATYAEALKVKDKYLRAALGRGEALHRQFRFDEELGLYEKTQGGRQIAELLIREARIQTKLGLDELAVKALAKAIFELPGDFNVRMLRGEAWLRLGDCEKALADFVEAGKIAGVEEKAVANEARGRALIRIGRPGEAEALLATATDAAGLLTLGAARYALMKWTEALDAFQQAADLDPENTRAMTNLGLARARTATDWEGIELALEILGRSREMSPLNYFLPPLGKGFAEQRRVRPEDEGSQAHLTQSVEHYKTAVEALPGNPYAHYILGRSYLRDGLYDAARKEFRTALFLDYHFSDALLGAGTANLDLGEWANARALLERFVTVELRNRDGTTDAQMKEISKRGAMLGRYRLGRAWIQSEDVADEVSLGKAKLQFEEIIKLDSTFVPAVNGLAYVNYLLDDLDGAIDRFNEALTLAPAESEEARYARTCLDLITEQAGRRRWVETFDRPNSSNVGNQWRTQPVGQSISPRIVDGKVQIAGRWDRAVSSIWLVHGDPKSRGGKHDRLNDKFIRGRAVLSVQEGDRVATQFLVYVQPPRRGDIVVGLGFERNARGHLVVVKKKTGEKKFAEIPIKDEDGNPMLWPDGEVTLEIERTDPKKGVFAMLVNGVQVASVNLGLKKGQGSLTVGFRLTGAAGSNFKTLIDEVEIELYEQ